MTGFGIVQKAVMQDTSLSCTAKSLYALLCSYAGSDGKCYPKVETLVHYLGITETTFYRALKPLRDKGYITTSQTKISGKFGRTLYIINHVSEAKTEVETEVSKDNIADESTFTQLESCAKKPCMNFSRTINQGGIYTKTNNTITTLYKNQSINPGSAKKIDVDMTEIKAQVDYNWFLENLPADEVQFVNVILSFISELKNGTAKHLISAVDCQTILDFREHLKGKSVQNIKNPIAYWRTAFYNFIREQSLSISTIPDFNLKKA